MKAAKLMVLKALLLCVIHAKDGPRFMREGSNVTVVVGRDASLGCTVENLHNYKVAWLRVDTQTILTIGPHVITKNHRVSVGRLDPQTWTLILRDARPSDSGQYMCQINTEPMITNTYHLQVLVPPDIVDSSSSGEVMTREGENASLHCFASGNPLPTITWRREDSRPIAVGGKTVSAGLTPKRDIPVNKWSGQWLNMTGVDRSMSGAFLCIATNGVPPSVSKRILLQILCPPTVLTVHQMIGGYIGEFVVLQCKIEGNPTPLVYWTRSDGRRLQNGTKYQVTLASQSFYEYTTSLTILKVTRSDVGPYHCHAKNSWGTDSDDVTLYTLATTTMTTTSTTHSTTTVDTTTTAASYAEIEDHDLNNNQLRRMNRNDFFDGDSVVVLSQHQMQDTDLPPSL